MNVKTKPEKHAIKPSTYASLITIVFLIHKKSISKSIASVIRSTDQLCDILGYTNNIGRMTKYRIVAELLRHDILRAESTAKNKKIFLSPTVYTLLEQHSE